MSWHESFHALSLGELKELEPKNAQTDKEQFEKARESAVLIAESGCMGDPTEHIFRGSLYGHVNENHKALPGWSPDTVSVSIGQVPPQMDLDKAANQEGSPYV